MLLWLSLTLGFAIVGATTACLQYCQLLSMSRQDRIGENFLAYLHYSEQLAMFHWLDNEGLEKQAVCRRHLAELAWRNRDYREALMLQKQLVNSRAGSDEHRLLDYQRLLEWSGQLWSQALPVFKAGNFEESLPSLNSLASQGSGSSKSFSPVWWNYIRADYNHLAELGEEKRWWDVLTTLGPPNPYWWQWRLDDQPQPSLIRMREGTSRYLNYHGHSFRVERTVPAKALEWLVARRLQRGIDTWQAFKLSCRDLGGHVIEQGPETFCW